MASFIALAADAYEKIISTLNTWLYTYVLIALLLGAGIYFTIRFGFIQFRMLRESLRVVLEPSEDKQDISSFQALMVSTASRVGTGNIAGIATALCLGGPGAMFWMWVTAIFGSATAFVEGTLAQVFKHRDANNRSFGGPAYYIEALFKKHWLGILYTVFMIMTYAGGFDMICSYNMVDTFRAYSFFDPSRSPVIIGGVIAAVYFVAISGGDKQIGRITEVMVPVMGGIYLLFSFYIVITHISLLPAAFFSVVRGAFDAKAMFGGLAGSCIMNGIRRGLYSNEAGVGAAATAAANAGVSHPVKSGLVQMLSVFIDTMVICTATGIMLLCSGVAPAEEIAGMSYVHAAVSASLGKFGIYFITVALLLFAFTTLIGNFYFAQMGLHYLFGGKMKKTALWIFRICSVVIVFLGATMKATAAWDSADLTMGLCALVNLPAIVLLSRPAFRCMKDYMKQRKESGKPIFRAKDIDLPYDTEYWK